MLRREIDGSVLRMSLFPHLNEYSRESYPPSQLPNPRLEFKIVRAANVLAKMTVVTTERDLRHIFFYNFT